MNYYDLYLIFAGYSFKESFCNKGLCIKVTKGIITLTFTTDFFQSLGCEFVGFRIVFL